MLGFRLGFRVLGFRLLSPKGGKDLVFGGLKDKALETLSEGYDI